MKHKLEGIGEAGASVILAGLAANPSTAALASDIVGKIVFFVCKCFCMLLANFGLIVMNVGAAKIETIITEGNFEEGWADADTLIKKIRATGRELTDEEIAAIDGPVIDAFRKFGGFGRMRKRRNS